jgi:uncharacterized protein
MIVLDANLLLYAYDTESQEYAKARPWLEGALSNEPEIGVPLASALAFARVTTDRRIFARPKTPAEMAAILHPLIERKNVTILQPTARHWPIFFELIDETRASGPLVTDAHIAALAIEHGATLYTNDRDFRRFPKLDVRFPLAD